MSENHFTNGQFVKFRKHIGSYSRIPIRFENDFNKQWISSNRLRSSTVEARKRGTLASFKKCPGLGGAPVCELLL